MRFSCDYQLYLCNDFFFSGKQIKSIASATTVQKDTTGKETEVGCTIEQERVRGLLAHGGGC